MAARAAIVWFAKPWILVKNGYRGSIPLPSSKHLKFNLDLFGPLQYNDYSMGQTIFRMTKLINDFNTKFKGSTAPKPRQIYTGVNMIGIAQIPKSNAVPVFSAKEARGTVKVK